jgi:ABC-2 type transport system permease protein
VSITRTLAWTDFKLRYAGSALGYFWTVSKPLLLFGMLYTIFTHVLRFGDGIKHYPVMLLFAIVLWTFFTEVTGRGVTVLVGRSDVLRKVALPRFALPLSVTFTVSLITAFNLLAVFVFVFANGLEPRWSWLLLLPLLAELIFVSLGITLILSVAYVGLRDIGQVWELMLQLMFYAAPIIYPLSLVPTDLRPVLLANPIAQIIQQTREALVGPVPAAGSYTDSMPGLLVVLPYAIAVILFAIGYVMFRRTAPYVAERL